MEGGGEEGGEGEGWVGEEEDRLSDVGSTERDLVLFFGGLCYRLKRILMLWNMSGQWG